MNRQINDTLEALAQRLEAKAKAKGRKCAACASEM